MNNKIFSRSERSQITLPYELKQILVGLILGDLHVFKHPKSINANLHFEQGLLHEGYLLHLYSLFESYCLSAPKTSSRLPDKRTGKVYSRIRFQTCSLPCFTEFYNLFYPNGKKIIPSNLGELITPQGLAYFAQDDGHLVKNAGFRFSTDNYTIEDVKILSALLNDKFDLGSYLQGSGKEGQYRIYVPKAKLNDLITLIGPHVHQSMKYKLGAPQGKAINDSLPPCEGSRKT